jgi:hypothetical protein
MAWKASSSLGFSDAGFASSSEVITGFLCELECDAICAVSSDIVGHGSLTLHLLEACTSVACLFESRHPPNKPERVDLLDAWFESSSGDNFVNVDSRRGGSSVGGGLGFHVCASGQVLIYGGDAVPRQ